MRRPTIIQHCVNPPAHARSVVKLRFVETNRYAISGAGGAGLEYRVRRGLPGALLDALDRDGVAFAYAWIDRNGRWRLEGIAPQQSLPSNTRP
jgi:hypothetical protein